MQPAAGQTGQCADSDTLVRIACFACFIACFTQQILMSSLSLSLHPSLWWTQAIVGVGDLARNLQRLVCYQSCEIPLTSKAENSANVVREARRPDCACNFAFSLC